jgi:hypothetical protein
VSAARGLGRMSSRRLPWGLVLLASDLGCGARRPGAPVLDDAARVLALASLAERASPRTGSRLLLKEEPLRGAVPGFLPSAEAAGSGADMNDKSSA